MDLNFPVLDTGTRIFRASNDIAIVGPLFVGPGSPRILYFFSSIRVDPGNRGPSMATSLLALKIRTPVANTGKLRSIGQMPVVFMYQHWEIKVHRSNACDKNKSLWYRPQILTPTKL
jgi:hypothetical protein